MRCMHSHTQLPRIRMNHLSCTSFLFKDSIAARRCQEGVPNAAIESWKLSETRRETLYDHRVHVISRKGATYDCRLGQLESITDLETACNGVRCGGCSFYKLVCRRSFAELRVVVAAGGRSPTRSRSHSRYETLYTNRLPTLSSQWNSVTFYALTGSVTGTEIVNTGTGQSHPTGLAPAGTAETVIVVIAEIDHADMTGTTGDHKSRGAKWCVYAFPDLTLTHCVYDPGPHMSIAAGIGMMNGTRRRKNQLT